MEKQIAIPEEFKCYINEDLLGVTWEKEGEEVNFLSYIIKILTIH